MKKLYSLIVLILYITLLQGCSYEKPDYVHFTNKPSLNYYIGEINNCILKGEDYTFEIFYKDVYKTIKIDDSEKVLIENFINSLTNDSYEKYTYTDEIEPFQIRITFNNDPEEKYIIKIYNYTTISVSPWDGIYDPDIISMKNVPENYNLYNFCTYVKERVYLNQ